MVNQTDAEAEELVSHADLSYVRDDKPDIDGWVRIGHVAPEEARAERGFDLTNFGTASNFEDMLTELNLNPDHIYEEPVDVEYGKVDKSPDEADRNYGVFVWANEDLALITGNNPLTGEYSNPEMRSPETGYASYIGLSGMPEAVREAWSEIKQRANHIKGQNRDEREFI